MKRLLLLLNKHVCDGNTTVPFVAAKDENVASCQKKKKEMKSRAAQPAPIHLLGNRVKSHR
jgi:hypothetical protein